MMLTTLVLAALAHAQPVPQAAPTVEWTAPAVHVAGSPYKVAIEITASGPLEAWKLGPAAFTVDGKPLGERGAGTLELPAGAELALAFDLGASLPTSGAFTLGYEGSDQTVAVKVYATVQPGALDFMAMEPADLAKYRVLLDTNRGPILLEMWPDVAPNHVRNYLDLASSGFFDGTLFHRVSPSFMIQGGDPTTRDKPNDPARWGSGGGPRKINAEFSDKDHVAGVLSAARLGNDVNSASSGFFIMTVHAPHLNGQYSAFGKVLEGMDAVQKIASSPGTRLPDGGTVRPNDPQRIDHAYVLLPD